MPRSWWRWASCFAWQIPLGWRKTVPGIARGPGVARLLDDFRWLCFCGVSRRLTERIFRQPHKAVGVDAVGVDPSETSPTVKKLTSDG